MSASGVCFRGMLRTSPIPCQLKLEPHKTARAQECPLEALVSSAQGAALPHDLPPEEERTEIQKDIKSKQNSRGLQAAFRMEAGGRVL